MATRPPSHTPKNEQRVHIALSVEPIHVHHHGDPKLVAAINKLGEIIMATSKELVAAVDALVAAVEPLPAAVDALEQSVRDALAQIGTVPAEVQADIDAAFAKIQTVTGSVTAAVTDATDGLGT